MIIFLFKKLKIATICILGNLIFLVFFYDNYYLEEPRRYYELYSQIFLQAFIILIIITLFIYFLYKSISKYKLKGLGISVILIIIISIVLY